MNRNTGIYSRTETVNTFENIKKLIMLCLCVATMAGITFFSSQDAEKSTELSVGISEKIVEKDPDFHKLTDSEQNTEIHRVNENIRNLAHFGLFLILGVFLFATLKLYHIKRSFITALLICVFYALFDETYQKLLNNGRTFQVVDLIKDWSGSVIGICLVALFQKIMKRKTNEKSIA